MDLAERPRTGTLDTLLADVVVGNDDLEPRPVASPPPSEQPASSNASRQAAPILTGR